MFDNNNLNDELKSLSDSNYQKNLKLENSINENLISDDKINQNPQPKSNTAKPNLKKINSNKFEKIAAITLIAFALLIFIITFFFLMAFMSFFDPKIPITVCLLIIFYAFLNSITSLFYGIKLFFNARYWKKSLIISISSLNLLAIIFIFLSKTKK